MPTRDANDPQTWVCELWWPPKWHDHFYAADFAPLREFGLLLLTRPGEWRVHLEAADPVAQFVVVWHGRWKVAEVSIDSDQPVPLLRILYDARLPERLFPGAAEAVDAICSWVCRAGAEPLIRPPEALGMVRGCCPFCLLPMRPTDAEVQSAEWAYRLADTAAPGGSRGGVFYRLKCPACAVPLIAAPSRRWAEVEPAEVEWYRDENAPMIHGGPA